MTSLAETASPEAEQSGDRKWVWVAIFLYLWLMVGFFLGTLVLVAPVGWITAMLERAQYSEHVQNIVIKIFVAVYVVASFVIAWRLNRVMKRSPNKRARLLIPAVVTIAAMAAGWAWRNPSTLLAGIAGGRSSELRSGAATFEFGAYPDEAKLAELKRHGITTVISLQHPAVVVEREGIAAENRAAKIVGVKLLHAPMLPWFSENREALDTIRALVKSGAGHYYVHCGLGRDRVNIVRKMIEGLGGTAVAHSGYKAGLGFDERTVPLGRGPIVRLAKGVWLIPYPDKEEMYACILEGSPGKLVFILDPADPIQKIYLDSAQTILGATAVAFKHFPVSSGNPATAAAAADSVRRMGAPLTVIAPATPGLGENQLQSPGWETAVAFRDAFLGKVGNGPSGVVNISSGAGHVRKGEARGAYDTRTGC